MRNKKFAAFVLAAVMVTSSLSTNIFAANTGDIDLLSIKSIKVESMDGTMTKDVTTSATSVGFYEGASFTIDDLDGVVIPTSSSLVLTKKYLDSKGGTLQDITTTTLSASALATFALPLGVTEIAINKTSGSSIVSSSSITITRVLEAFRQGFFRANNNNMTITSAGNKTYNVTYTVPANSSSVDFSFTWPYGHVNFDETNASYYGNSEDYFIPGTDGYWHNKLYFSAYDTNNYTAASIKTTFTYADWYKDNNDYTYNIIINRPAATTTTTVTGGGSTSSTSANYSGVSMGSTIVKSDSVDSEIAAKLSTKEDIIIALKPGVNSTSLSKDSVNALIENKKTLYVIKDGVTLTITPDAMANAGLDKGKMEVILKPYTQADIAAISKMDAVNKTLYKMFMDVKIKVNNSEVKNYPTPLLLSFDTSKLTLTDAQKAMLTGIRVIDDSTYNQLGGNFNGKKFEFFTSSLSNYGIIVSNNLVKIATTVGKTTYTLNGKSLTSDVAPVNVNGSVMVPIRFVAEAFGAKVTWDDSSKTVGIDLGSNKMNLTIDQKLPGMNVAPTIIDDRALVPLRYVSETLGANVAWDDATKTVSIAR